MLTLYFVKTYNFAINKPDLVLSYFIRLFISRASGIILTIEGTE